MQNLSNTRQTSHIINKIGEMLKMGEVESQESEVGSRKSEVGGLRWELPLSTSKCHCIVNTVVISNPGR